MVNAIVFLVGMYLIYNYLIFGLIDTFLKKPKLKKIFRIPVGILNTLIFTVFAWLGGRISFGGYMVMGIVLFVEFIIFYKDKYLCSFFCALACIIHIMSIRAVFIAIFAIVMNSTIYDIASTPVLLTVSTGITFMFLSFAVFLVVRFVPAENIRIINQHEEQLKFMVAYLSIFGLYLFINANIYGVPSASPFLLINQIIAPLAILIGTYVVLFFAFRTSELLGYKEKNEELKNTMEKERQYRTTVDKDVFRVIEANFNKGEIISGFDDYEKQLGDVIHDYGKMLVFMIRETVHPEDRQEFIKYLSPLTLVKEFEAGRTEIEFDYRRRMPEDNYVWMHVLIALMQATPTADVMGFVQIKDIDEEKKQQIELQYKAERDLLTGLYNKVTTEVLISKQLSPDNCKVLSGVLFVIDIDNFKNVNDRLGHLYGDAVLSGLSENLRKAFRECDIVGRIGGDEFLVFAEGLEDEALMAKKANNICTAFLQTYAGENKESYSVSSSIGMAVFPKDGKNFEELFRCADTALYTAKAQGKNGYAFFDENVEAPYLPTRTEIDNQGIVQKNFKDNRVEYVFRLLYGSENTKNAIESALELIAKNFGFSRANIFEFNELSTHFNGVFEWCDSNIASVSANYVDMPVSSFDFIVEALVKSGGMFMAVPTDFPENSQESYTSIGIKSIVHFSIIEHDKLMGVIAFQYCKDEAFELSDTEFEELRTVCQVLSIFMAKQLSSDRELRHHQAVEAMMDNMNCISYVIDRENYTVYYENQNTLNITGKPSIGKKCHLAYRGLDEPCEDCALNYLTEGKQRCTIELYTEKFDIYTQTSGALINWSNDRQAMLISSVDITEYKKAE